MYAPNVMTRQYFDGVAKMDYLKQAEQLIEDTQKDFWDWTPSEASLRAIALATIAIAQSLQENKNEKENKHE